MDCVFCKIAAKELSSKVVYENDKFFAFKDINPISPVHVLIIPRKHIETIEHIGPGDKDLVGELFLAAKKIARIEGVSESGYRLIFNVGKNSGQAVDHLHLHLLGGKKLTWK